MKAPVVWLLLAAASAALAGCGRETDTRTTRQPLPNAASLIPEAPTPRPTARPTPGNGPEDETWPTIPGGGPTSGGRCGDPEPPPVSTMAISVHGGSGDRLLLDSTPLVGPDAEYCRRIGYTDARLYCPVRPEGSPERFACEAARVGRASDTGRVGPTWSVEGRSCDGSGDTASCVNHPSNQYQVFAYGSGTFRACTSAGACGTIALP